MKPSNYSNLIRKAITRKKMTLGEVSLLLKEHGQGTNAAYLSKLQNGKLPPAGDKLNDALASVLEIDTIQLKAEAYRERISPDVLERLKSLA